MVGPNNGRQPISTRQRERPAMGSKTAGPCQKQCFFTAQVVVSNTGYCCTLVDTVEHPPALVLPELYLGNTSSTFVT